MNSDHVDCRFLTHMMGNNSNFLAAFSKNGMKSVSVLFRSRDRHIQNNSMLTMSVYVFLLAQFNNTSPQFVQSFYMRYAFCDRIHIRYAFCASNHIHVVVCHILSMKLSIISINHQSYQTNHIHVLCSIKCSIKSVKSYPWSCSVALIRSRTSDFSHKHWKSLYQSSKKIANFDDMIVINLDRG